MRLVKKSPVVAPVSSPRPHPRPASPALPRPRRAGASKGLVFAALLAMLVVGVVAFWATRDDGEKSALRQDARALLLQKTRGTPLESWAARLLPAEGEAVGAAAPASEVPPLSLPEIPPSEDGSLAGNVITAPVAPLPPEDAAKSLPVPPQLRSDDRVTPAFVSDIARFFVARHSGGGGGQAPSVQQLNQYYGTRLTGLTAGGADVQARRAALLRYAFHPAMLEALYGIYADRFLDSVIKEAMHPAQGKGLTEAQTRQLCISLGGRLVLLAGGLEGVRKTPDIRSLLSAADTRAQEAQAALERMQGAMLHVDEMQARGDDPAAVARERIIADKEAAAYRNALRGRDEARRAAAAAVRQNGGQGLDDATLLYLTEWVARRLQADASAGEAVGVAARLLRDLGRRFAQAGAQGLPEPLEQRLAREQQEAAAAARLPSAGSAPQSSPSGAQSPASGVRVSPRSDSLPKAAPVLPAPQERLLSRPPSLPPGGALTPPARPVPAEARP